jgi:mitochondrial fission protein ELM1
MALDAQPLETVMKALVLSDGKPGHFNQSIALCKNTDMDYEIIEVAYRNKTAKALSYLFDRLGIYTEKLFRVSSLEFQASSLNLLISTGSTSFYPNKVLARRLGLPNIAILNPSGYRPDFSAILCPAYDRPPKQSNVTELPINLCAADPSFFQERAEDFKQKHAQNKPAIGFVIGGPNAVSAIDPNDLKKKIEQAFDLTEGCERWVTTSRRTPKKIEKLIESFPFDYTLINSRDPYNPIPAFIQLCDRLFVTSDSASMVSECASFGSAKVEILMNRQLKTPNKFQELFQGLEKMNAVHIFDGTLGHADQKVNLKPLLENALKPLLESR